MFYLSVRRFRNGRHEKQCTDYKEIYRNDYCECVWLVVGVDIIHETVIQLCSLNTSYIQYITYMYLHIPHANNKTLQ